MVVHFHFSMLGMSNIFSNVTCGLKSVNDEVCCFGSFSRKNFFSIKCFLNVFQSISKCSFSTNLGDAKITESLKCPTPFKLIVSGSSDSFLVFTQNWYSLIASLIASIATLSLWSRISFSSLSSRVSPSALKRNNVIWDFDIGTAAGWYSGPRTQPSMLSSYSTSIPNKCSWALFSSLWTPLFDTEMKLLC